MNSEKVGYFLSISNKIKDEAFMIVFSIFFSLEKKKISFEFSHFGRSLSYEKLFSPLLRYLSFEILLSFILLSFYRTYIS